MLLSWSWSDIGYSLLKELMIIITTMEGIVVIANMFVLIGHMLVDVITKSFNIINDKRFHVIVIIIEDGCLGIFERIPDPVDELSIFSCESYLNIVPAFFYCCKKHVRKDILFKAIFFQLIAYFSHFLIDSCAILWYILIRTWSGSSAGLECRPVTAEVAGSSPVQTARYKYPSVNAGGFLLTSYLITDILLFVAGLVVQLV